MNYTEEHHFQEPHDMATKPNSSEFEHAYMQSMNTMHNEIIHGMHSSDPDMAFSKGMLSHHKGAVAMAEVHLKYGKDMEMRQLAENIIETHQFEIALIRYWIARN